MIQAAGLQMMTAGMAVHGNMVSGFELERVNPTAKLVAFANQVDDLGGLETPSSAELARRLKEIVQGGSQNDLGWLNLALEGHVLRIDLGRKALHPAGEIYRAHVEEHPITRSLFVRDGKANGPIIAMVARDGIRQASPGFPWEEIEKAPEVLGDILAHLLHLKGLFSEGTQARIEEAARQATDFSWKIFFWLDKQPFYQSVKRVTEALRLGAQRLFSR